MTDSTGSGAAPNKPAPDYPKGATPGPWKAIGATLETPDGAIGYYIKANGMTANSANASLIAAAPELFEAVRLFVIEYDARDEADGVGMLLAYARSLTAGKAALAKARGEVAK